MTRTSSSLAGAELRVRTRNRDRPFDPNNRPAALALQNMQDMLNAMRTDHARILERLSTQERQLAEAARTIETLQKQAARQQSAIKRLKAKLTKG